MTAGLKPPKKNHMRGSVNRSEQMMLFCVFGVSNVKWMDCSPQRNDEGVELHHVFILLLMYFHSYAYVVVTLSISIGNAAPLAAANKAGGKNDVWARAIDDFKASGT